VLARRRSERRFTIRALTEQEIAQLLWAAQGITDESGGRTSPSAGALYPLELYAVTPDAYGHYLTEGHRLEVLAERDLRRELAAAVFEQSAVARRGSPIKCAVYARTEKKYGARGRRYAELEAGHAAQRALAGGCARARHRADRVIR
jgi:SagB-type dehydrogenase family enzyme